MAEPEFIATLLEDEPPGIIANTAQRWIAEGTEAQKGAAEVVQLVSSEAALQSDQAQERRRILQAQEAANLASQQGAAGMLPATKIAAVKAQAFVSAQSEQQTKLNPK